MKTYDAEYLERLMTSANIKNKDYCRKWYKESYMNIEAVAIIQDVKELERKMYGHLTTKEAEKIVEHTSGKVVGCGSEFDADELLGNVSLSTESEIDKLTEAIKK
jgi:hypothetical protein